MAAEDRQLVRVCLEIGPSRKVLTLPLRPSQSHVSTLRDEVKLLMTDPKTNISQHIGNCDFMFQKYNDVFDEFIDLMPSDVIEDGSKLKLLKLDSNFYDASSDSNRMGGSFTAFKESGDSHPTLLFNQRNESYKEDCWDFQKTNHFGSSSRMSGNPTTFQASGEKAMEAIRHPTLQFNQRDEHLAEDRRAFKNTNRTGFPSEVQRNSDAYAPFERKQAGLDEKKAYMSVDSGAYSYDAPNHSFDGFNRSTSYDPRSEPNKDSSAGLYSDKPADEGRTINIKKLLSVLQSSNSSKKVPPAKVKTKETDDWISSFSESNRNTDFLRKQDTEVRERSYGSNGDERKRRSQSNVDKYHPRYEERDSRSSFRKPRESDRNKRKFDEASSSKSNKKKQFNGEEVVLRATQLENVRKTVWKEDSDPFLKEPLPAPASANKYSNWVKAGTTHNEEAVPDSKKQVPNSEEPAAKKQKFGWKERLIWEGQKLGFNTSEALSTRAIYEAGLLLKNNVQPVRMLHKFCEFRNKLQPEFIECWDGGEGFYKFYVTIGSQHCIESDRHSFDFEQARIYAALKALHALGRTKSQVKARLESLKQQES